MKNYNGRNKFFLSFIVRMPGIDYCIRPYWLGRSRSCVVTRFCHAFEVEAIGNCSPASLEFKIVIPSVFNASHDPEPRLPSTMEGVINITAPLKFLPLSNQESKLTANCTMEFNSRYNCSPGVCLTINEVGNYFIIFSRRILENPSFNLQ